MSRGPKNQKRPADVIGNAVRVMQIATGEAEDDTPATPPEGRKKGGKARAEKLSPEERSEIASRAARVRWDKR